MKPLAWLGRWTLGSIAAFEPTGLRQPYIHALLPDSNRARDVLQETNLVLWRKRDECRDPTAFVPWARRVAKFQVLASLRDHGRERLRFDPELVERLAEASASADREVDDRQRMLDECLAELDDEQRSLLESRYARGGSVRGLAERLGRSVGSVSQSLYRIRQGLLACVDQRLKGLE